MGKLVVAANPFTYFVRSCAFDRPMCPEPGLEIDLLKRIANQLNVTLTLLPARGWNYENNQSILSMIRKGEIDITQSNVYTKSISQQFMTTWPHVHARVFPIVKAPSEFAVVTYDFIHYCTIYVWLGLIATWISCYILKIASRCDATQKFPIKNLHNLPTMLLFFTATILLNLFSNRLSIALAYPPSPRMPFRTLNELRVALLQKRLKLIQMGSDDYYVGLLNLSDIKSRITMVTLKGGSEHTYIQAARMVTTDPNLVSIVGLNTLTGTNMFMPLPDKICNGLSIIKDDSFPSFKAGFIFNKKHPSWLYRKLNYTFTKAMFATFTEEVKRYGAKHHGCFEHGEYKAPIRGAVSLMKSRGGFLVLVGGLSLCILFLLYEYFNSTFNLLRRG